jgi:hypothetical protein
VKNEHSEKLRQIMLSKELSSTEKREQLRALIPPDVSKIENLNRATLAQLKQLQEAIEVAQALQQLNAALLKKKRGEK